MGISAESSMNKHILVVEDDADLGKIVVEILHYSGFEVEHIRDGAAALERLHTQMPDVLLLDLHLPTLSGDKLLEIIRADEKLKDLKVVVMTADSYLAESLVGKADRVYIKPLRIAAYDEIKLWLNVR